MESSVNRLEQPYQYSSLNISEHEIRLMTLLPGAGSAAIEIRLETISFNVETSQSRPTSVLAEYEALSYVWGSKKDPARVLIRSGHEERTFVEATQNLAAALVDLRYPAEPRVLWIDAICINQKDKSERSSQVARMADIYRLADRVVVWLGPGDAGGGEALSLLGHIGSQIEVDWDLTRMRCAEHGEPSWADRNVPARLEGGEFRAIHDLVNRSWFERLWVRQEIGLANERAIIMCGTEAIDWWQFSNAIFCICRKPRKYDKAGELKRCLQLPYYMARDRQHLGWQRYANTLRDQVKLKCEDPRDRIFAVLSISAKSETGGNIQADYSKTVAEVYQEFALKQIMQMQILEILSSCELGPEGAPNNLPSWVPDWQRPILPARLQAQSACGHSQANVKFDGERTLSVTGVKVATVSQAEKISEFRTPDGECALKLVANSIQRCLRLWLGNLKHYAAGGSAHHALLRTLCANTYSHLFNPLSTSFPDSEMGRAALGYFLTYDEESTCHPDYWPFITSFSTACEGRSCVATDQGYIGLAPTETRVGDLICVFLGCDVPMAVRPMGEGKFALVGECYCDRIMDGAALLGPLPEGFQLVWNFEQALGMQSVAYIDRRSGEVQGEDPRLVGTPLPPGWHVEPWSDGSADPAFVQEVGDGSQKPRKGNFDPRMSPEALRQRGVDIVEFDLV